MRMIEVFVLFLVVLSGEAGKRPRRSSCFCSENECCSKWGFCGKTEAYCGEGCQSGACQNSSHDKHDGFEMTWEIFACVFPTINADLRARRWQGFREAMEHMEWKPMNSIDAAVFFSHVSHETDGLKTLTEYCANQGTCDNYQSSWCSIQARPNVKYYGRGWFQLSYPCNYYYAGKALDLNLLDQPDLVSENEKIAAATAIWYYLESGMNEFAQKDYFSRTTRMINEYECTGKAGFHLQAARVETYHRVRKCFALPAAIDSLHC